MKPEEIAPHVDKGDRLVTVQVEVSSVYRYPANSGPVNVVLYNDGDEMSLPTDRVHSIRPVGEACEWTPKGAYYAEWWSTGCGNKFEFTAGGPPENGQKFCGYCGKPIKEVGGWDDGQEGGER